jgi:hypothetical protein
MGRAIDRAHTRADDCRRAGCVSRLLLIWVASCCDCTSSRWRTRPASQIP